MEYIVPQFIEKESKILGPFTFKQTVFILIAFVISAFLYFTVPFPVFILLASILFGTALSLIFLKPKGFPLPTLISKFFIFLGQPKIYLWGKKNVSPQFIKPKELPKIKTEVKEETSIKVVEKSRLKNLATFLETSFK